MKKRPSRRELFPALALCAALMSGCGGGQASVPAAGSAGPQQGGRAQATFRIDEPKNAATANKRSAQYVSPATTQMVIDILQNGVPLSGYPVSVPLTPNSGGCTSTLASTNCQLTISIALGSYTATLTAEDANGTALSSAQSIAFTVGSGANTIPVTLSGIPHALQIAAGASAIRGVGTTGLTLFGAAAQPVIVTALDADGNTIVGPGSPTYSASVVSGSGWSAAAPASTAPNTIAITPPGTNNAGATFNVTASYSDTTCSLPGAVCSTTFTIKNDIQTLFVVNQSGSVTVYAPPYTGAPTTVSTGVNAPQAMTLDGALDLFVANYGANTVTEYAPPYTGAPTTISSGVSQPSSVLLDGAGNLFVANFGGNTVTEYAPPYTSLPAATINIAYAGPWTLLLDSSANLFVGNRIASTVLEYAKPYSSVTATVNTGVDAPFQLVFDAAGNLFSANVYANTVTEYAPPYTGTPTTISTGVHYPEGLAIDNSGNLFVANFSNNTVTVYAPPYTGTPTTISSGIDQPAGLAIDGAGNLFVANYGYAVTEYAPPYTGSPTFILNGVGNPVAVQLTP